MRELRFVDGKRGKRESIKGRISKISIIFTLSDPEPGCKEEERRRGDADVTRGRRRGRKEGGGGRGRLFLLISKLLACIKGRRGKKKGMKGRSNHERDN